MIYILTLNDRFFSIIENKLKLLLICTKCSKDFFKSKKNGPCLKKDSIFV